VPLNNLQTHHAFLNAVLAVINYYSGKLTTLSNNFLWVCKVCVRLWYDDASQHYWFQTFRDYYVVSKYREPIK